MVNDVMDLEIFCSEFCSFNRYDPRPWRHCGPHYQFKVKSDHKKLYYFSYFHADKLPSVVPPPGVLFGNLATQVPPRLIVDARRALRLTKPYRCSGVLPRQTYSQYLAHGLYEPCLRFNLGAVVLAPKVIYWLAYTLRRSLLYSIFEMYSCCLPLGWGIAITPMEVPYEELASSECVAHIGPFLPPV
jgi:hypothetical protein